MTMIFGGLMNADFTIRLTVKTVKITKLDKKDRLNCLEK